MQFKYLFYAFIIVAFVGGGQQLKAEVATTGFTALEYNIDGGKEKKQSLAKPSKHARQSAKDAKNAMKLKRKQVMGRAKVRLFFHNMFNRKYGKPVNFRSKRQRNRWKKGRMG